MKLFAFAASLRKGSFNKKLVNQASEALKGMGVNMTVADLRDFEIPLYDGDLEDVSGIPSGAKRFMQAIAGADGLVISTPEYNGGIPGVLKNAIDWVSREEPHPLIGKPILLMGATPGGLGAVRGLWHTRVPLEALNAYVFPPMFGVPRADRAFDDQGKFVDPKMLSRMTELLEAYVDFVSKVSSQVF